MSSLRDARSEESVELVSKSKPADGTVADLSSSSTTDEAGDDGDTSKIDAAATETSSSSSSLVLFSLVWWVAIFFFFLNVRPLSLMFCICFAIASASDQCARSLLSSSF